MNIRPSIDEMIFSELRARQGKMVFDFSPLYDALNKIDNAYNTFRITKEPTELLQADISWHIALARLPKSQILTDIYSIFSERLLRTFFICYTEESTAGIYSTHGNMTALLESGDIEGTRNLLISSCTKWGEDTRKVLNEMLSDE